MAQVPTDDSASVLPAGASNDDYLRVAASPEAFGATIGTAVQGAGETLAKDIQAVQGLQNETDATNISTDYFAKLGDLKGQFYAKEGQDAINAQPEYTKSLLALRDSTLAQATNPMMKAQLAQDVQRMNAYALAEIGPYVAKQTKAASVQASASRSDQMITSAVGVRNDPAQIAGLAARGAAEVAKIGELQGWDKDTIAAKTSVYNGKLYSTVIGTLAVDDPPAANQLYQSVRGSMDATSQERVAEMLKPKLLTYNAAAGVNAITGANDGTLRVPPQYQAAVTAASKKYGVPENAIAATVQHESNWDANAINPDTQATGLGQMLPSTAADPGYGMAPIDINSLKGEAGAANSIDATAAYLAARGKAAGVQDWNNPEDAKKGFAAYYSGKPLATQRYAQNVAALAYGKPQDSTPTFQAPSLDDWTTQARAMAKGDPELEQRLVAGVTNRYHQWESQTATQRAVLGKTINDTGAALLDGRTDVGIPEQQIRALYPAAQADTIVSDLREKQDAGSVVNQVRLASPDALASMRAQMADGIGPAGGIEKKGAGGAGGDGGTDLQNYALKSRQLAVFDKVVALRKTQIADDPAAYALQAPGVQTAMAASRAAPQDATAAQNYANALLAEQARLGVPEANRSVLTKPQATQLAQTLRSMDPATGNVAQALNGIEQQYGSLYPQVFHALVTDGKLDPEYAVLGSMNKPEQLTAQADMQRMLNFKATKGGAEQMRAVADPAAVKAIDAGLNAALDPFRQTVQLQSGGLQLLGTVQNSVKNLATYYSVTGAAKDGDTALAMAVKGVLENHYDFRGSMRTPSGLGDQFNDTAASVQNGLKADDLAANYVPRFALGANDKEAYLTAAQGGKWIPNAKDDGGILMGNFGGAYLPVRRKDGSQIELRFNDIRNGTATTPPTATPSVLDGRYP